jgi:hypothetical protein
MEKRPAIWYRLQEHSTPPPPEVTAELLRGLATGEESFRGELGRLQELLVMPPDDLRVMVRSQIGVVEKEGQRATVFALVRRRLPYVAAAVLLVVGGWMLIQRGSTRRAGGPAASGATVKKTGGEAAADKSVAAGDSGIRGNKAPAALAANPPGPVTIPAPVSSPSLFTIGGHSVTLEANDYLGSFISYPYADVVNLVHDYGDQPMRIHVDQYADLVLGAAMKKTIRDLYSVRDNGTPTRTARRTKERLLKWRAADVRTFDGWGSNPLDPVDLGEFLYPPFFSFGRKSGPGGRLAREDSIGEKGAAHPAQDRDLTVSYTLSIQTQKSENGLADTYDGGIQTLFSGGGAARLRLVSLMRIQSIFLPANGTGVVVEKESGRKLTKTFTLAQWSGYNRKYREADCQITADTAHILGYVCKKANLTLKDGRKLTAWYTTELQCGSVPLLEPAFAALPGLPLRYEYTCRRKTVCYTATSVSRKPVNPAVFIAGR